MSINRSAAFGLPWLDAKTRGRLPADWEERIRWAVSADPFYDADFLDYRPLSGGTLIALGLTQAGVLPPNTAFIPHLVAVGFAIGIAGSQFTGRPVIARTGLVDTVPIGPTVSLPAGLPNLYTDAVIWEPPARMVLGPGTVFGWETSFLSAGGAIATNCQMIGVRIPLGS